MSRAPENRFSPTDLERLTNDTFLREVDFHEELGSTNDRAMQLAGRADDYFPLLVLTESQSAGRGRGKNTWWSHDGSLTFSVMLATSRAQLPTERWPQVSLTVGLAVCEALESILARGVPIISHATLPAVQLKWPNDVYIEGRKICGVLIEAPPNCPGKLLIGIGINVNNSIGEAPEVVQASATALIDLTGRNDTLCDVLIEVLKRLDARLMPNDFWNDEVRAGWRKRCYLTGKRILIDNAARQSSGICQGIDDSGALLVEVDGHVEKHLAGTITLR